MFKYKIKQRTTLKVNNSIEGEEIVPLYTRLAPGAVNQITKIETFSGI